MGVRMNYAMFSSTLSPSELDQTYFYAGTGSYNVMQELLKASFTGSFSPSGWVVIIDYLLALNVIDQTRHDALIAAWTSDNPNQNIVASN